MIITCQHCERENDIPDEELLRDIISEEDLNIIENIKDYWKHLSCGAEQ